MKQDYDQIKVRCEEVSHVSEDLIDNFLVYYAGEKDKQSKEFDSRVASFKHITQVDRRWENMLKSQYIAHRIFRAGGLLRRYLNHVAIKQRSAEELAFLQDQLAVPWRFSFSKIIGNPAADFYEMLDVVSDVPFLLYSKAVTLTLAEQPVVLWFSLISFNGSCWETYGPVNGYGSFDLDDIFFFGTEVNSTIDSEEALMMDVERNPVPYMMLLHGASMPLVVNDNDEVVMLYSDYDDVTFEPGKMRQTFKVEYNDDIYRLTVEEFEAFPHHAAAYYDEPTNLLAVTAMTDKGFDGLVQALNSSGVDVDEEAQIRIHLSMLLTAGEILKRKIEVNPFEKFFEVDSTVDDQEHQEKIHHFLELLVPEINEGRVPDANLIAAKAGIDPEIARMIINDLLSKRKGVKKKKKK
jgi:hypothetical protein